jgi:hypothetical protein
MCSLCAAGLFAATVRGDSAAAVSDGRSSHDRHTFAGSQDAPRIAAAPAAMSSRIAPLAIIPAI